MKQIRVSSDGKVHEFHADRVYVSPRMSFDDGQTVPTGPIVYVERAGEEIACFACWEWWQVEDQEKNELTAAT